MEFIVKCESTPSHNKHILVMIIIFMPSVCMCIYLHAYLPHEYAQFIPCLSMPTMCLLKFWWEHLPHLSFSQGAHIASQGNQGLHFSIIIFPVLFILEKHPFFLVCDCASFLWCGIRTFLNSFPNRGVACMMLNGTFFSLSLSYSQCSTMCWNSRLFCRRYFGKWWSLINIQWKLENGIARY